MARVTSVSPLEPESPVKKFFKLVLPSTMKKNMMRIPPRFVRLHGSKLSEVITLETPLGFKRSIKLKRIGGEIWFQEGWSEFAEAHSISEGHFLLFEYKGNSRFCVIIFDVSACEVKYPVNAVHITDSDDEIIDLTNERFLGTQGPSENAESANGDSHPKLNKIPRDIEFENLLIDVDAINSVEVLKVEEGKRVFRG